MPLGTTQDVYLERPSKRLQTVAAFRHMTKYLAKPPVPHVCSRVRQFQHNSLAFCLAGVFEMMRVVVFREFKGKLSSRGAFYKKPVPVMPMCFLRTCI